MSERVAVTIYAYINRDRPQEQRRWEQLYKDAQLLANVYGDIDAEVSLTEGSLPA